MSERHTRVRASQIKYIEPADINAINSPSSGNSIIFKSGSKFEWTDKGLPFSNVVLISGSTQYWSNKFETILCYVEDTNTFVYLPSSHSEGDKVCVKTANNNDHYVVVFAASNQRIDGFYRWYPLGSLSSITVISDGEQWWIVGKA